MPYGSPICHYAFISIKKKRERERKKRRYISVRSFFCIVFLYSGKKKKKVDELDGMVDDYKHVLALIALSFNRHNTEGTNSSKIWFNVCACIFYFMFVYGLVFLFCFKLT